MRKEQFQEEINYNENKLFCSLEYALAMYNENVEPYLELITNYRNSDKFLDEDTIRLVLNLSKKLWSVYKRMPTVRQYLDLDRDLMSMKAKKDIIRGVKLAPDNGKLLELQAKRFDSFYHDDGKPHGEDIKVSFSFEDASMDEKEIVKKSGIKEDDIK